MNATLDGRAVMVTGGGSGIGRATALEVTARGGTVAVVDRNVAGVDETVALVAAAGGRAVAAPADVSDEDAVREAVARSVATLGRLDGVVTAAGIFDGPDLRPLADVSLATFTGTLAVNLTGTFLAMKYTLPHLERAEGEPRAGIVTIASTAGLRGHGFGSGYTASKGGVVALHAARGAPVRTPRRARELRLPGRREHADDRGRVGQRRIPGADETRHPPRGGGRGGRHRRRRRLPALARRAPPHRTDHRGRRRHHGHLTGAPPAAVTGSGGTRGPGHVWPDRPTGS